MTQRPFYSPINGGLDLVTPPIRRDPGRAIGGCNYEPRPEGYRRIDGHERFDGRPLASVASYWVLRFDTGSAALVAGQTVTGATSSTTGELLVDAVVEGGAFDNGDAAGYLVLTAVSGAFGDGEALQVSGVTKALADGTATERGASNDATDQTWLRDATETQRAKIGAVPGSGPIRGVWALGGTVYAWRDNSGGTACVVHKSSATGWQACDLGRQVAFDSGGTYVIAEGDTITGASSGATATVKRVVLADGDWPTGDAQGRLILANQAGTFGSENLNVGSNTNVATIAGNSTPTALQPGGRYEFVTYNFGGGTPTRRIYGCDGVNPAFEWDGTVYVPILTGMTDDKPIHIAAHRGYLFLAYRGGSLQFSSLGDPFNWTIILGAGELGIGEEITGLVAGYAGILAVLGRNRTGILYGTVFGQDPSADGDLRVISEEAGAIEWSVQALTEPTFLDDRGVRTLGSTDRYGDFNAGTASRMVKPYLDLLRRRGRTVVSSLRVRDRNQYRLFWDDGTGFVIDFGGKAPAFMPLDYGKVWRCTASVEDADGVERLYAGSDDGYVYRLDSGTSFDGAELTALLRLTFNSLGSPTVNKRFHKAALELTAAPTTTLYLSGDFSYGDPDQPSVAEQEFSVAGGGGFWNEATWNEFYWSSRVEGVAEAHLDGIGTSISIAISTAAAYEAAHTIHGLTLHYTVRGMVR